MALIDYIIRNYKEELEKEEKVNEQRNDFIEGFPFEKLKALEIDQFGYNGEINSFMRFLSYLTDQFSGNLTRSSLRLITYDFKENKIQLEAYGKRIKKEKKHANDNETFEYIKNEIYDFVESFTFENYKPSDYLNNQNVIKFKLLRLYRTDVILFGTGNIEALNKIFIEDGVKPGYVVTDAISGSIILTNYIKKKLPNYQRMNTDIINLIIYDYSRKTENNTVKTDSGEVVAPTNDNNTSVISVLSDNNFSEPEASFEKEFIEYLNTTDLKQGTIDNYKGFYKTLLEEAHNIGWIKSPYLSTLTIEEIESIDERRLDKSFNVTTDQKSTIKHLREFIQTRSIEDNKDDLDIKPIDDNIIIHKDFIIYSGVPGCGKSYLLNEKLKKLKADPDNIIRTTFYPDYSYTDFIGQIIPSINDGKIKYVFNPGPFALALLKSYQQPNDYVYLIIEEINRGNASSIFGDIFQLLDRDEEKGESRYEIYNLQLQNYLNKELDLSGDALIKKIRIPSNLALYGTMNTSDQNVFTLDNAFKRRVSIERISNDSCAYGEKIVPGTEIEWKKFVESINEHIVSESGRFIKEDKQLGMYFFREKDLCDHSNCDEDKIKRFANKLFDYLWNDVAFMNRNNWFNEYIKTLDDLINKFVRSDNRLSVFSESLKKLIDEEDEK